MNEIEAAIARIRRSLDAIPATRLASLSGLSVNALEDAKTDRWNPKLKTVVKVLAYLDATFGPSSFPYTAARVPRAAAQGGLECPNSGPSCATPSQTEIVNSASHEPEHRP